MIKRFLVKEIKCYYNKKNIILIKKKKYETRKKYNLQIIF